MNLRVAREEDKRTLEDLLMLITKWDSKGVQSRVSQFLEKSDRDFLIAVEDAVLIGYAGIREQEDSPIALPNSEEIAHIAWLGVHPNYRKRGTGSSLLQACNSWALKHEKKKIWLDCLPKVKVTSFYEQNGYRIEGTYNFNGRTRNVLTTHCE
ncbi:MAG: GNAT family N-acetyltransferase [Nanoarchaeota archaeon]